MERGNEVVGRREFLAGCTATTLATAVAGAPAARAAAGTARGGAPHDAPLAFWALTGKLRSDDLRRHLDAFASVGWGVVLYPRWGLELEYLGAEWFERVRFIVEQAAARGMEVWLYDEFCWPSGHAKGLVTEGHPELEAQILEIGEDGATSIRRCAGSANLLDPAATARFLEVTHARYESAVGEFFGSTVRAIFTDEPSLAHQHRPRQKGGPRWELPWSAALDRALGGDLRARLAALGGGRIERAPLWADFWAAYARVFHEAWVTPLARWCSARSIALTGHLLGEGGFGTQVAYNGSLRRQLDAFGIPGIDEIGTRDDVNSCEALTFAMAAEFPGRERMAELYALGPPTMKPATMERMLDLCAASGVDRYVLAICPLDLRGGVKKREYLGLHGPQQPWFQRHARLYTARAAEASARARDARPLGIPWPSDEELWAVAGPDPGRSGPLAELTRRHVTLAREAIRARLEETRAPGARAGTRAAGAGAPAGDAGVTRWRFEVRPANSLRIDRPELEIVDVPRDAWVSVQEQLVRALRVNGRAIDLGGAPPDIAFDASYRRVALGDLLRAGANRFEIESDEPAPLRFLPALVLWGEFAVDAAGRLVRPPGEIAPGDWRARGYPALCGAGSYRAEIECATAPGAVRIDSGGYPTRVIWNGREAGGRAWNHFEFDLRGLSRPGRNEVTIEVSGTLGHLLTPGDAPPIGLLSLSLSLA